MDTSDDLKLVFTGSAIDATFIKEMLEESGIGAMVRNSLRESLSAGFVSGAQEDCCRVFVTEEHFKKAKKLIDEYENSIEKKDEK